MADIELYKRMYEVSRAAFDEELARVEFYDRKASIVFGVSGVILAFMVGRIDIVVPPLTTGHWLPWFAFGFYVLSNLTLFISLLSGARAITFRNYQTYPDLKLVLDTFSAEREIDLVASMAHHFAKTTAINEISNQLRAAFSDRSLKCLQVAILLVLLFVGSHLSSAFYTDAFSKPPSGRQIKMSDKNDAPAETRQDAETQAPPKVIPMQPREVQKGADPSKVSPKR